MHGCLLLFFILVDCLSLLRAVILNCTNAIIIIIIIIIENRTEDVVINMITELSFIRDDIFLALVLSKTDIDEFISALCSTGI
jgi:GTPase SAR1 family protein